MRNKEYLDSEQPEDNYISELMIDEDGNQYRMVNGKKIIQIEEKTQSDKDLNLIINRIRALEMTRLQYLQSQVRSIANDVYGLEN